MIPKLIHYCWFGRGLIPFSQKEYIKSWGKIMPEYEVKLWNENNFDVKLFQFTHEAHRLKKYSLVTDVVRLKALYEEGGIYLDTDVEVFKPFDEFLKYSFFSGIEIYPEEFARNKHLIGLNGLPINKSEIFTGSLAILAAVIGAEKGNLLIKDTLDYFTNQPFIFPDGSLNLKIINPAIIAHQATKYGFVYQDKMQELSNNMLIFPSKMFPSTIGLLTKESILLHHSAQSWVTKSKHELFLLKLDKLNLLKAYKRYLQLKRNIKQFLAP